MAAFTGSPPIPASGVALFTASPTMRTIQNRTIQITRLGSDRMVISQAQASRRKASL